MSIGPSSIIPAHKLDRLRRLADEACGSPGDLAELGVYLGGSAWELARIARRHDRVVHLFDTFDGMPPPGPHDWVKRGDFRACLEEVQNLLDELPAVFHVGVFPAVDLPPGPFCFVHLDCDLYQSYRDGLSYFWPRMVPGAILVMDDFDLPGQGYADTCAGATLAARQFFSSLGLTAEEVMRKDG
jgi:predicted O-methyltransferase YrrM